jgi:hypothetical protein
VQPNHPPLPGGTPAAGPASTREIPVVQPAHAAGPAMQQPSAAATAAAQPQPTGPVDYVPGPPPAGAPPTAPAPAPAGATAPSHEFLHDLLDDEPHRPRDPRAWARLTGAALGLLAVALVEIGLLVHQGAENLWSRVPLWSGFVTVAAVAGLVAVAGRLPGIRLLGQRAWAVGAGGLAGVAVFWLLVVLPWADTDRGFLMTAALACLGGAVWLTRRGSETAPTTTAADERVG